MDNDVLQLVENCEKEWAIPDVSHDEPPNTALAVKAHNAFSQAIQDAQAIMKRAGELKMFAEKDGKRVLVPVTKDNYNSARILKGLCVKARGIVESTRKQLKADAMAWGKVVDETAGEREQAIREVETPLAAGIKAIDDEAARVKREKAEAEERARVEEARRKIEAEAEAERQRQAAVAESNRIEAERLAKEREEIEAERRQREAEAKRKADEEALRIANERAALEAERKRLDDIRRAEDAERLAAKAKLDAERRELAEKQQAFEREQLRIADERAAAERAERERIAAEQRAKEASEREERLRPDCEKINAYAKRIQACIDDAPALATDEATGFVFDVCTGLGALAKACANFGKDSR